MFKLLVLAVLGVGLVCAQTRSWVTDFANRYNVQPNITYSVQNNYESKLDLYERRDVQSPQPTLFWIHGGGWVAGTKEGALNKILPYLEMGWNVVNVEYRLGKVSLAPAAVEDCLCALRWVAANAAQHHIDPAKLVVSGDSAGGHLSLTTGMIPQSAGLDRQCPGPALPRVAAIVDWYGITDVNDLLDGPNQKTYTVQWLGSLPNKEEIARRVSPIYYVREGGPPVFIIHGNADPTVPYQHSVNLKQKLDTAKIPNQLFTVPGGKHGGFTNEQYSQIYPAIREFLQKQGLPVK